MPACSSSRPSRRRFPAGFLVLLSIIANPERGADKTRRLERLIKLQRLDPGAEPGPQIYKEIADTLTAGWTILRSRRDTRADDGEVSRARKPGAAWACWRRCERRAGHIDAALAAAQQAAELDPNDAEVQILLAELLGDTGKVDEAVEILRKAIKNEPDNARYRFDAG